MKVIITDDEIQIRKGLRMKIDWEKEGIQIIGEASNGQVTLDLLKKVEADAVITDVRMPIMDGIEFVKRCYQEHPNVKVIVLSGYADFEYVKSSMIKGVKDYLLKPVAPEELVESLKRIKSEIEEEKRKQNALDRNMRSQLEEMREKYLLYFVKEKWAELDMSIERIEQLGLGDFVDKNIQAQFVTVEIRGADCDPNIVKELWLPFRTLCREIAQRHEGTYSFYDVNYKNMIHFIHRVGLEELTHKSSLVKEVQRYAKELMNVETVIAIGKVFTSFAEFKNGYISALLSWSQSQLDSKSQIIDGTMNKELLEFLPADDEKKLINAIENVNHTAVKNNIYSILDGMSSRSIMSFSFVANRLLFLLGFLARKYDVDTVEINNNIWKCQQSIWELNSQDRVVEQLIHLAQSIREKIHEGRCSANGIEIVENIRCYLDQHYANEISLTTLSDQFHINSTYLSEIFKSHIGQNFSDYLINLRMDNAQRFLKDKQLKIIDVAHLVGFSNSGYFSTVFKKHFGQTPIEFRKSINSSR